MDLETAKSSVNAGESRTTGGEPISLFQPDPLLHTEFFEQQREQSFIEPEKKLMLAVLEDAIFCFQENHQARQGERKRAFDQATHWLFASTDWVFGFENICGVLGFEPGYIRSGLRRWRQNALVNGTAWASGKTNKENLPKLKLTD